MVVRNVHEDELFKRFARKDVVFTTIQMMSTTIVKPDIIELI